MVRFSLPLVAVALAVSVGGCAQCDTCDDFPLPCMAQNGGCAPGMPPAFDLPPGAVPPGAIPPGMGPGSEVPMIAPPPLATAPPAAATGSAPLVNRFAPPPTGAFSPGAVTSPNSAARAEPLPRGGDSNSPPPPTSLGDAPKG